ncbi:MAG: Calx-beta domain-containing protein [Steroidobacteraceae bacterium]
MKIGAIKLIAGLLAAFLAGCSGAGAPAGSSPVSGIGAAGGTVSEGSGAKVVVPAGALAQTTPIAVTQSSDGAPPLPAGIVPVGPIYAFTPHGTVFQKPVTITVPFDASKVSANAVLVIYKTNATRSAWELVAGATVDGNAMSGAVSGFSNAFVAAEPPQGFAELTEKDYRLESFQFTGDTGDGTTLLAADSQTGGALSVRIDVGEALPIVPPAMTLDGPASVEVFSNDTGKTYFTVAEAPHTSDPLAVLPLDSRPVDGSRSVLTQTYTFRVVDPSATLKFILTHADQTLIDGGGHPTDDQMCPWLDPAKLNPADLAAACSALAMNAENSVFVNAYKVLSPDDFYSGNAEVMVFGSHPAWTFQVTHFLDGEAIWQESDFTVDQTPPEQGGLSISAVLAHAVAIDIPLNSLLKDDVFNVRITLVSRVWDAVQGESYAGAYLRDPVDFDAVAGAVSIEQTGLEQLPVNHDPRPDPVPVACTSGVDPAAGQIQFKTSAYTTPERPLDVYVEVERAGGTQGEVKVLLESVDGTATAGKDYEAQHRILRFADGTGGTQIVPVSIRGDNESEQDETFDLKLSAFSACAALGAQTTTVTILDDDRHMHAPDTFTLGGTVTGLTGTGLVVKDLISGGTFTANSNGPFTLSSPTPIFDLFAYDIIIATQPTNPEQSCTVAHATGTVEGANVTDIAVNCVSSVPGGDLDPSFGSAGKVTTTIAFATDVFDSRMGMALQQDGRILLVGGLTLVRFNPDGSLDTGFGTDGQVKVPFNGGAFDGAEDVAVQSDGKIVVVGVTDPGGQVGKDDFAIARFNADGSSDTAFGAGGMVTTDFHGRTDTARRVRILPDGKLLVAGFSVEALTPTTSATQFAVARYNTDGSLDTGFGTGGKVEEAAGASFSLARGTALQSDGKIIIAGSGAPDGVSARKVALTRLFGDGGTRLPGTRDDTFGPLGQGFDLTDLGTAPESAAVDVAVLADDTILTACEANLTGQFEFCIASFDKNDSERRPQPAFISITGQSDRPRQMLLQSDGKAVIVGRSGDLGSNPDMAIVRFAADGLTPDATFGADGIRTVDFFGGRDGAEAVVQQPDGKLVIGGFAHVGNSQVFALARLTP